MCRRIGFPKPLDSLSIQEEEDAEEEVEAEQDADCKSKRRPQRKKEEVLFPLSVVPAEPPHGHMMKETVLSLLAKLTGVGVAETARRQLTLFANRSQLKTGRLSGSAPRSRESTRRLADAQREVAPDFRLRRFTFLLCRHHRDERPARQEGAGKLWRRPMRSGSTGSRPFGRRCCRRSCRNPRESSRFPSSP